MFWKLERTSDWFFMSYLFSQQEDLGSLRTSHGRVRLLLLDFLFSDLRGPAADVLAIVEKITGYFVHKYFKLDEFAGYP